MEAQHQPSKKIYQYQYSAGNGPVSGTRYYGVTIYDADNNIQHELCRTFRTVGERANYLQRLRGKFRLHKTNGSFSTKPLSVPE